MWIHAFCDRFSFMLPVQPGFYAFSANKRAFRQRVGGKLFACSLAGHGINIFPTSWLLRRRFDPEFVSAVHISGRTGENFPCAG